MTLEANVLRPDAVRSTAEGYEIDVHLAWYRSLPLSCIENITLSIAGKAVDSANIHVCRDGRELTIADLADRVDDWWFIQDPITVKVRDPAPVAKGSKAEIQVELATRIPYIVIGPDMALVQRTKVDREVTVQ